MASEEESRALEDAALHGSGYIVNGKHVPFAEVMAADYHAPPMPHEEVSAIFAKYGKVLERRP